MKLLITSILLLIFSFHSFGQTCNCNQEFVYIKDKIEKNYAGFNDKVTQKTKAAYQKHTKIAFDQSKLITKPAYCIYLINDWLSFFKDGHIQIGRNRISKEKEKNSLQIRVQDREILKLTPSALTAAKKATAITGIYQNEDSTIRIAIIKNKNSFRDYAGVVISSKSNRLLPGQVILELKNGRDTLKGILYDKYEIPQSVSFSIKKDVLGNWQREGTKSTVPEPVSEVTVASKILSQKTLYLKIGTFNQSNAIHIDSLFKVNRTNLNTMPNLILDLRNNGGGADFAYTPVTPYLYTSSYQSIGADVFSTDDNIAGWAAIATTDGLPADQKTFISEVIKKMEQHKGKFVSFAEDRTYPVDSAARYPQKIVILMNRNCGSTTEEFLLLAKQSSKVTLMGEHTAGVLDYANVRGAEFSCMPYMLYWATSRSRRIDMGMAIDNVGIKPDKVLKPEQNWVKEAQLFIEK